MEQQESSKKYGGEDASTEELLNCLRSSTHKSTCPPLTNSDLGSHESSVHKRIFGSHYK